MPKRQTPFGSSTLVDAKEIAGFLGCSAKSIRLLAAQGKLPKPIRVGRLQRWVRQAIEDWIAAQA
jgi:predicted DNA-binding transcriptional regulator AlpA